MSFSSHLGLEHASPKDDEFPWIESPDMAYPSPSVASIKSSTCIIHVASLSGFVRPTMK
jgi:hypothetical protein